MVNIWTVWNVVMDFWQWFYVKCHWIFYEKQLLMGKRRGLHYAQLVKIYSYIKVLASIYFGAPLILALVWYLIFWLDTVERGDPAKRFNEMEDQVFEDMGLVRSFDRLAEAEPNLIMGGDPHTNRNIYRDNGVKMLAKSTSLAWGKPKRNFWWR